MSALSLQIHGWSQRRNGLEPGRQDFAKKVPRSCWFRIDGYFASTGTNDSCAAGRHPWQRKSTIIPNTRKPLRTPAISNAIPKFQGLKFSALLLAGEWELSIKRMT